jgi:DNA repair exonuclease SbcCD ATPase subunit
MLARRLSIFTVSFLSCIFSIYAEAQGPTSTGVNPAQLSTNAQTPPVTGGAAAIESSRYLQNLGTADRVSTALNSEKEFVKSCQENILKNSLAKAKTKKACAVFGEGGVAEEDCLNVALNCSDPENDNVSICKKYQDQLKKEDLKEDFKNAKTDEEAAQKIVDDLQKALLESNSDYQTKAQENQTAKHKAVQDLQDFQNSVQEKLDQLDSANQGAINDFDAQAADVQTQLDQLSKVDPVTEENTYSAAIKTLDSNCAKLGFDAATAKAASNDAASAAGNFVHSANETAQYTIPGLENSYAAKMNNIRRNCEKDPTIKNAKLKAKQDLIAANNARISKIKSLDTRLQKILSDKNSLIEKEAREKGLDTTKLKQAKNREVQASASLDAAMASLEQSYRAKQALLNDQLSQARIKLNQAQIELKQQQDFKVKYGNVGGKSSASEKQIDQMIQDIQGGAAVEENEASEKAGGIDPVECKARADALKDATKNILRTY